MWNLISAFEKAGNQVSASSSQIQAAQLPNNQQLTEGAVQQVTSLHSLPCGKEFEGDLEHLLSIAELGAATGTFLQ